VKVDGYNFSNGFDPKGWRGLEHSKNPNGSSLLHMVEDPKQI